MASKLLLAKGAVNPRIVSAQGACSAIEERRPLSEEMMNGQPLLLVAHGMNAWSERIVSESMAQLMRQFSLVSDYTGLRARCEADCASDPVTGWCEACLRTLAGPNQSAMR
jgi:hypothetical protein